MSDRSILIVGGAYFGQEPEFFEAFVYLSMQWWCALH